MKISSVGLLLMASLAFVLLGCSDNSAPVVASTSVSDNHATPLMKSSGSGATILRGETGLALEFYDPDAGLVLVLGVNDLAAFCSGQGGWLDVVDFKRIFLPDTDPTLKRMVLQMKDEDMGAIVWAASGFVSPCVSEPIAVGTVRFVRTDNDFYASSQDNNNSNAYGISANGTLVGQDGQVYMLNFVFRGVWDGEDNASRKVVLKIQLTPTGKE